MTSAKKIISIEFLRAFAVFLVVWNHFVGINLLIKNVWLDRFLDFPMIFQGRTVFTFFVISGFLYPDILMRALARGQGRMEFLVSRILRLWIPTAAAVLLVAGIIVGSDFAMGRPLRGMEYFALDIPLSLLLLVDVLDKGEWVNMVQWNIPQQIQFVLLVALMTVPKPTSDWRFWGYAVLLAVLSFYAPKNGLMVHFGMYFAAGIGYFLLARGKYWEGGSLLAICMASCIWKWDWTFAFPILLPALAHLLVKKVHAPVAWLAKISFSLYLLHMHVGNRILNPAKRLVEHDVGKIFALLFAIAVSVVAAWLFWKFVESPSHRFAKRFAKRFSREAVSKP